MNGTETRNGQDRYRAWSQVTQSKPMWVSEIVMHACMHTKASPRVVEIAGTSASERLWAVRAGAGRAVLGALAVELEVAETPVACTALRNEAMSDDLNDSQTTVPDYPTAPRGPR